MESVGRLYIDSNIFIYMFESDDERAEALSELFSIQTPTGVDFFATSELTLSELLVRPYRMSDDGLIRTYSRWITPNSFLTVAPVERGILQHAARLRAKYATLRLPDAIHLATALALRCTHFLSGDERLQSSYELENGSISGSVTKNITILRPVAAVLSQLFNQNRR